MKRALKRAEQPLTDVPIGAVLRFKLRGEFVAGKVVGFEGDRVKVVLPNDGARKTVYKRNRSQLFAPASR